MCVRKNRRSGIFGPGGKKIKLMKKIFYNKRHKVPVWSQIYLAWFVVSLIGVLWIAKIEIIAGPPDIKKTYDHNAEYNRISALHFKIMAAYPDIKEYGPEVINGLNAELSKKKWQLEESVAEIGKLKCRFIRYGIINENPSLVVLFDHDHVANMFYFLHIFVLSLIQENLHGIVAVSVQGGPVCTGRALRKYTVNNAGKLRYLHVYTGETKNPGLRVVNSAGEFSSVSWSGITPDSIARPAIVDQLGQGATPVFQKSIYGKDRGAVNGIGWVFSNDLKNNVNLIHSILPPLVFTVKNYVHMPAATTENSFWVGNNRAITKRGVILVGVLLVLLIWMPVANRLYQGEEIGNLLKALFSVIYGALPFLVMAGLIKAASLVAPTSVYLTLAIGLLAAVLLWIFNKMQVTVFNFNAGSLTEFVAFLVFASFMAFQNISLFFFLIPAIFVASKKGAIDMASIRLLLFLTLLPVAYVFYSAASFYGFEDLAKHLAPIWLDRLLFFEPKSNLLAILFAGSFVMILRRPK